jgi:hypothetical protein
VWILWVAGADEVVEVEEEADRALSFDDPSFRALLRDVPPRAGAGPPSNFAAPPQDDVFEYP